MDSFENRQNLSLRRKNNKKRQGNKEKLPIIKNFHGQLRQDLNSCRRRFQENKDEKWGRWVPSCRFNVNQAPLPFVVDQDTTYEVKGSISVWIAQPSCGLDKRQCTLQLCISPTDQQVVPQQLFSEEKEKASN